MGIGVNNPCRFFTVVCTGLVLHTEQRRRKFNRKDIGFTMKVLEKLGFWMIPLVIMIILSLVYFGPTGFFEKLKDTGKTLKEYAPNVSIGLNELSGGEAVLSSDQASEITNLKNTIEKMLKSPHENCFGDFGGFGEELGSGGVLKRDRSTNIFIKYDSKINGSRLIVANDLGQIYRIFNLSGMHPCVVAGEDSDGVNIANNFYNHFLDGETLSYPYYSPVDGVEIFYQSEWSSYNGNTLRVIGWEKEPVNDEGDNLESKGILFKGKAGDICFFPTNKASTDDDGLNNDAFDGDDNSIPYKLETDELDRC